MNKEFTPKLFTLLKQGISKGQLSKDLLSGIIVGIVALPLAIAFAIASGVSPEKGLITAIIAGLIISTFGGSRVQIGGPTGAFIVILYGIVQEYGVDGLTIATLMAGFILIGLGLAKLGNLLKFIPYPLIVGFTSGIALIILTSQINDFFGLHIPKLPADFINKWTVYFKNFDQLNWNAFGIALFSLVVTKNFNKVTTKIPGAIIAIILTTLAVKIFHIPVDTIESNFGEIPNHLSLPSLPNINFETIKLLLQPAFAIALLGAIESLLSAVVADAMIGGNHRSNIELIAQGGANVFSALFGGIPATGAIARTATNVKNGGRTPIAGIVHSLTLLAIMLLVAPYAKLIPMACLAGILTVVAYNMSEWRQFKAFMNGSSMDIMILLTTFFLTVIFDLVIAIEMGIVLSSLLFMKRMSESVQVQQVPIEGENAEKLFEEEFKDIPEAIALYEINGPLFFGAARQFQDTLSNIFLNPKVIIIRMRYVPFIDASGYQSLKSIIKDYQNKGIIIILSGVEVNLRVDFEKNGLFNVIDKKLVLGDIVSAMEEAKKYI